jgi:hypothetical protein
VLSWQGSAFLVALVSAVIAGRAEATPMRWLGRAPLLVQLALALMVAAVVGYILLTAPS